MYHFGLLVTLHTLRYMIFIPLMLVGLWIVDSFLLQKTTSSVDSSLHQTLDWESMIDDYNGQYHQL